ncbi:hypothetical protein M5E87_12355 [Flavonifractor plautii]|nr:hypothetical protein M5E87_12355 [Flavonifractor plautii]
MAAYLVAASAVLVLVLAVAGLLAFIVTSAGAGSSWNASMDELSAALVRTEGAMPLPAGSTWRRRSCGPCWWTRAAPWCGSRANLPMCPTATPLPMWPPLPAGI